MNFKLIKKKILNNGFCILKDFFSAKEINKFENTVVNLFLLQAKKIGEYRKVAIKIQSSKISNFAKFSAIYEIMEEKDKEALYQVQKFLFSSNRCREIFNNKFSSLMVFLLNCKEDSLLIDGPALFVNRPRTERLLYKWHSEAHYYPKRRNFINIWSPIFSKKNKSNGTMSFKVKSHLKNFPFSDYQGYNKNSEGKNNHFIQYEIPSNLLKNFKEFFCEVKPNDLVIFHKDLVHTSNLNSSSEYSVSLVARAWDPTNDLTLSGTIHATPYGGNIGRSDLVVDS